MVKKKKREKNQGSACWWTLMRWSSNIFEARFIEVCALISWRMSNPGQRSEFPPLSYHGSPEAEGKITSDGRPSWHIGTIEALECLKSLVQGRAEIFTEEDLFLALNTLYNCRRPKSTSITTIFTKSLPPLPQTFHGTSITSNLGCNCPKVCLFLPNYQSDW